MRVALYYPSLLKEGRRPLWGQNRQFKFAHSFQIRIYPLVPATAATWLKEEGHEVLFLDAPNTGLSREQAIDTLKRFQPDLVAMDSKAPLMGRLKEELEADRDVLKCRWAIYGDLASALPERVLKTLGPDYLLTGGDYDWMLLGLVRHLDRGQELPGGVWRLKDGEVSSTGDPELMKDLDQAPRIDRKLTGWQNYGEAYLHAPATYILTGRGCGGKSGEGGQCAFCVWQHSLWQRGCRLRSPEFVVEEIERLCKDLGVREIFDDNESGTTWSPEWMDRFLPELERRRLRGKVILSANARADHLSKETCALLKRAGFRLLKVGLESGNDETLRHLRKAESVEEISRGIRNAKAHGLRVLMTVMVGYPWETEPEVRQTLKVARSLLNAQARFGDCLQASVLTPYPGTPLYEEAVSKGWFRVDPEAFERFDMDEPVLHCPIDPQAWCKRIWRLHFGPAFVARSLITFRPWKDMNLAWRGVKSLWGHVRDYS